MEEALVIITTRDGYNKKIKYPFKHFKDQIHIPNAEQFTVAGFIKNPEVPADTPTNSKRVFKFTRKEVVYYYDEI